MLIFLSEMLRPKHFILHKLFLVPCSLFFVLCPSSDGATVYNYVTAAGEVGSGTPSAASGRHFSPLAPRGNQQQNNGLLEQPPPHRNNHSSVVLVSYRARGGDGSVDFREKDLVIDIKNKLLKSDKNIAVLHIVCGSKTGLVYPSLSTVKMLQLEFGDRLVVVVDACQLRCRTNTASKYTDM